MRIQLRVITVHKDTSNVSLNPEAVKDPMLHAVIHADHVVKEDHLDHAVILVDQDLKVAHSPHAVIAQAVDLIVLAVAQRIRPLRILDHVLLAEKVVHPLDQDLILVDQGLRAVHSHLAVILVDQDHMPLVELDQDLQDPTHLVMILVGHAKEDHLHLAHPMAAHSVVVDQLVDLTDHALLAEKVAHPLGQDLIHADQDLQAVHSVVAMLAQQRVIADQQIVKADPTVDQTRNHLRVHQNQHHDQVAIVNL